MSRSSRESAAQKDPSRKPYLKAKCATTGVPRVAFSADGQRLLTSSHLYDLPSRAEVCKLALPRNVSVPGVNASASGARSNGQQPP